jgi:uncharacterized protein
LLILFFRLFKIPNIDFISILYDFSTYFAYLALMVQKSKSNYNSSAKKMFNRNYRGYIKIVSQIASPNFTRRDLIMANKNDNKGKMTVEEAGRKGGEATSRTHDKEFYKEIGEKGGKARSEQRDDD